MVIFQNFLKSMEVIFSIEYIIPPLIIDRVFNRIFPVLSVISVYYCIGCLTFHIYPTSTLQCLFLYCFPPFHCQNAQLKFCVFIKDFYHFASVLPKPLAPNQCHYFEGGGLLILLHLPMQMLWHRNFPFLIFSMIDGPFSTTPTIIVHGIHIFTPQRSLPHRNMKFKWIQKRLAEFMSPFHAETRTGYLYPKVNVREQRYYLGVIFLGISTEESLTFRYSRSRTCISTPKLPCWHRLPSAVLNCLNQDFRTHQCPLSEFSAWNWYRYTTTVWR